MTESHTEVAIIGGGISGCALLYLLAQFTDLNRVTLLDKYPEVASVNSHGRNNSQTLHCGDIETNYTLEKALHVQAAAQMVVNYTRRLKSDDGILFKYPKMVLGVGDKEMEALARRFESFQPHFPAMRLLDATQIAAIEPNVTAGRTEPIAALAVLDEYCAVNFQSLAQSFVREASSQTKVQVDVRLSTKVTRIEPVSDAFLVHTTKGNVRAPFVVVSAGAHSLLFAQSMGYGKHYACLPIAGSFYYAPSVLNGKVYTVQNERLPFAAIHGDPDLLAADKTRFGPTALVIPVLERYNLKTMTDFFKVFQLDRDVLSVLGDLLKVSDIRSYMLKNFLFEVPLLRQWLFLRDAKKIVPSLKLKDLKYARRIGGIRPVMIDKPNRKLHLGEAKISPGNGIIFNMTPSPGATSCLQNARQDLNTIVDVLNCRFDNAAFEDVFAD
jgi:malate dehydrogenase (quinone)